MRGIKFSSCLAIALSAALASDEAIFANDVIYDVGAVNNLVKVRRDDAVALNKSISLEAARNEIEPFQVILSATQPLKGVKVTFSDLQSDGGAIKADQFKAFIQHYHHVEKDSSLRAFPAGESTSTVGQYWPDALIPYEPFDVEKGNQGVWIQFNVPADAKPGAYRGTLTVAPDNAPKQEVDVELTVWDFVLPTTPTFHMMGAVHIGPNPFAAGPQGSEPWKKQWKERTLWFLDQGMSPCWFISDKATPSDWIPFAHRQYDDSLRTYLDHPNCTTAQFSYFEGDWDDPSRHAAMHASAEWIKKNYGDRIAMVVRTADEPPADTYPDLRQDGIAIHKIHPDLKVLLTSKDISPALEDGVDYWCPFFTEIGNRIQPDLLRKRRERGEQVWFYANDFTFPVDIQAIHHRVVGWAAARYGLQGEYQFSINEWWTEKGRNDDPFKTLMSGANGWNGGSWLAWPGEGVGHKGLLSSIRLSQIRQWMEDYEYFELLKKRIAEVQTQLKFEDRWLAEDRVWEIASGIITDAYHYNPNANHLFAARRALANEILETTQKPLVVLAMTPRSGETTDLDKVSFRGAVEAGATLQINGKDHSVNAAGHFEIALPLVAGDNAFTITISHGDRTKTLQRNVTYRPDAMLVTTIQEGIAEATSHGVEIPGRLTQAITYYETNGGWGDARRRDEAKRLFETLQLNRYRTLLDKFQAQSLPDSMKKTFVALAETRAQAGQFEAAADMLTEGLNINAAGSCTITPTRYEDYYGWELNNGVIRATVLEEGARIMTMYAGDVPLMQRGLVRALDLGEVSWRDIGGYEDVISGSLDARLSQQSWRIAIDKATGDEIAIRATREFSDRLSQKLRIVRVMSLKKDSPTLNISYEIHNLDKKRAEVAWRSHIAAAVGANPHNIGGDPEGDQFILADDAAQTKLKLPSFDSKANPGLATDMAAKIADGFIAAFDPTAKAALVITTDAKVPYAYIWYETNDNRPYDNPWKSTRNRYTIEPNNTLGEPTKPFVIPPQGVVKFETSLHGLKDVISASELRERVKTLSR